MNEEKKSNVMLNKWMVFPSVINRYCTLVVNTCNDSQLKGHTNQSC